jgi:hypothetical protein
MQLINPGQQNTVFVDMLNRGSGNPLISGTVNTFLIALNGSDAGDWFRGSDQTWQASEEIAAAASHKADGHWLADIHADAWSYGVEYLLYGKESGNLHIPYADQCVANMKLGVAGVDDTARIYTVTDGANPLQDVEVWVASDIAGQDILYRDFTNASGEVVFWLPAGTWYYWSRKAGYQFSNPDTEVYT